ncbi:MAG: hypothetical protein SGI87_00035 [Flavobacteriales bacterium]|nr:hypothetical protein [Flavobacteriales bacterium]
MKNSTSFLLKLIILIVLVGACIFAANFSQKVTIPEISYVLVLLYGLITFLLYRNIISATKKNPQRFVTAVMGSIIVKLFTSAIIVTVYVVLKQPNRVELALSLFFIYAVFTALLTSQVSKDVRTA